MHVRPWLYRIAQNAALEVLDRGHDLLSTAEHEEEHGADPQEAYAARGALLAALRTLPDRQRRAFLLREVHGLRMSEIAERLALTSEQVEQALFAARNHLAERLVFGERLNCETVLGLADEGPSRTERRALKSHLRACASCRAAVSGRVSVGLLPFGTLAWLRQLVAGLLGGGGVPVAAKVGAVAVTAALAAGVPVAGTSVAARIVHRHAPPAHRAAASAPSSAAPSRSQLAPSLFVPLFLQPSEFGGSAGPAGAGGSSSPSGNEILTSEPPDGEDPSSAAGDPQASSSDGSDSGQPGSTDAGDQPDPAAADSSDASSCPDIDCTGSSDVTDPPADASGDPAASDPALTDTTLIDPALDPTLWSDPTIWSPDPAAMDPTAPTIP